jgi:hypothetical protein
VLLTLAVLVLSSQVAVAGSLRPGTTPASFARRADAICADYRARVARLPRLTSLSDLPRVHRLAVATLRIARLEVAKVHALALPAANRSVAQAWVATRDRLLVLLTKLRDAAKRKDGGAVATAVATLNRNGARGHALARRLGMRICSLH